jgi:hypothetical protein
MFVCSVHVLVLLLLHPFWLYSGEVLKGYLNLFGRMVGAGVLWAGGEADLGV